MSKKIAKEIKKYFKKLNELDDIDNEIKKTKSDLNLYKRINLDNNIHKKLKNKNNIYEGSLRVQYVQHHIIPLIYCTSIQYALRVYYMLKQ
jgi:hypothetical protein